MLKTVGSQTKKMKNRSCRPSGERGWGHQRLLSPATTKSDWGLTGDPMAQPVKTLCTAPHSAAGRVIGSKKRRRKQLLRLTYMHMKHERVTRKVYQQRLVVGTANEAMEAIGGKNPA